jgi:predicted Fe-Mo cluster-binding NifX family protein
VLLFDLDSNEGGDRHLESLGAKGSHERAKRLADMGVKLLVCGAISWPLEALLVASGIQVIPLICGDIEDVISALRDGAIDDGRLAMPGCCCKRRHGRNRRRGKDGGLTREETA